MMNPGRYVLKAHHGVRDRFFVHYKQGLERVKRQGTLRRKVITDEEKPTQQSVLWTLSPSITRGKNCRHHRDDSSSTNR